VYDPATARAEVLLDGLYFAAGVALPPTEDYVLVAETARYRISRLWLKGPAAGRQDTFADNLPGFVGGIRFDRKGRLWVAIPEPRVDLVDRVSPNPALKNLLAKLPPALLKGNEKGYGLVLVLDGRGRILRSLHDPTGRVHKISAVRFEGGDLYFGSSDESGIGRFSAGG
jgi:sugar lactone lactonase YvrE